MIVARVAVYLAIVCTLAFNAAYGFSRGATAAEQASLVLLALIIDLAKTSFLAAAAHLAANRHRVAALIIFVLWWPAFALSTWNGYSYIATSRATTADSKTTASDGRKRAQNRYDRAKGQLDVLTADKLYATSVGCTLTKPASTRAFCSGYDAAMVELKAADAALATVTNSKADPETALVATWLAWPQSSIEILVAFIPALFIELVAALGFYAISRPVVLPKMPGAPKADRTAVASVLQSTEGNGSPAAKIVPAAPAKLPAVEASKPTQRRRLVPVDEG